jgi:GTP-binding protein HflX
VEDSLFATLDATTRRLALPGGESVLCTDTVGFVRKLPHQLVEAFQSTLQVAADAHLLVHVVDATAPDVAGNIEAVHTVLREIDAGGVPQLLAFNKADLDPEAAAVLVKRHPGSVAFSARTGEGVDDLLDLVSTHLRAMQPVVELHVPYGRGDVLAAVHREGEVLVETHGEGGTTVQARLDAGSRAMFAEFETSATDGVSAPGPA